MAAAATAALLAALARAIVAPSSGFAGLEHALERVAVVAGIRFVNDSKATNVESARRAIESFDGRLVPIIGGRFKGGDLRDLRPALPGGRPRSSRSAKRGRRFARRWATCVAVIEADSMAEAVRAGLGGRAAGRHGGARARVRQFRHVPRLRGARARCSSRKWRRSRGNSRGGP